LVEAQRPVFGSLKLAAIKQEKSFVRRVLNKQDEGLFRKSSCDPTGGKHGKSYELFLKNSNRPQNSLLLTNLHSFSYKIKHYFKDQLKKQIVLLSRYEKAVLHMRSS